ncbi:hypothetical protein KI387_010160, partial [Taxus chinensis]
MRAIRLDQIAGICASRLFVVPAPPFFFFSSLPFPQSLFLFSPSLCFFWQEPDSVFAKLAEVNAQFVILGEFSVDRLIRRHSSQGLPFLLRFHLIHVNMPGGGEGEGAENFYSVLGLKSDCTNSELRNAYKKLAMKWHPDRWSASGNPKVAEESKKNFQAIQQAYSVLSDDKKRFLYDAGVYEDDDDNGMREFLDEMMVMMNDTKTETSGSDSFEELQDLFMEMFEGDLHGKPAMQSSCGSKRNFCGSVTMEGTSFMIGTSCSSFNVQSFCVG